MMGTPRGPVQRRMSGLFTNKSSQAGSDSIPSDAFYSDAHSSDVNNVHNRNRSAAIPAASYNVSTGFESPSSSTPPSIGSQSEGAPGSALQKAVKTTMNRLGQQISAGISVGSQQLAQHAVTAVQAAGASFVAGLKTCDEKSAGALAQFEIRVDSKKDLVHPPPSLSSKHHPTVPAYNSTHGSNSAFTTSSTHAPSSAATSPSGSLEGLLMSSLNPSLSQTFIPTSALALTRQPNQAGRDGPSSGTPEPLSGEVWGTYPFFFQLKVVDSGPLAGSLLCIARRPNTNRDISLRCRWKRRLGDRLITVPGICGTSYQISADDVGCKIVVEAVSTDADQSMQGTAYGEIGPFELDPLTRKTLDDYLSSGSTMFSVRRLGPAEDKSRLGDVSAADREDELALYVSSEVVKVIKPGPLGAGYVREWIARYGSDTPRVELVLNHAVNFQLHLGSGSAAGGSSNTAATTLTSSFSNEESSVLKLAALGRHQRDLLTLTIRCFHGRQWVITSSLLERVSLMTNMRLQSSGLLGHDMMRDDVDTTSASVTDFLVIVQRLHSELCDCLDKRDKAVKERDRAIVEKNSLELDLGSVIEGYQKYEKQYVSPEGNDGSSGIAAGSSLSNSRNFTLEVAQRAACVARLENTVKEVQAMNEKNVEELELIRRDYKALSQINANYEQQIRVMSESLTSRGAQRVSSPYSKVGPGGSSSISPNDRRTRSGASSTNDDNTYIRDSTRGMKEATRDLTAVTKTSLLDGVSDSSSSRLSDAGRGGMMAERGGYAREDSMTQMSQTTEIQKQIARLQHLNTEMTGQNAQYEQEISRLNNEIARLKQSTTTASSALTSSAANTQQEFTLLSTGSTNTLQNGKFDATARAAIQAEIAKAYERLREDFASNFLYIKKRLEDALAEKRRVEAQLKSVTAENKVEAAEKERRVQELLQRIREVEGELQLSQDTVVTLTAEKNRLQKKSDALAKDLEKSRQQFEQMSTKLVDVNGVLSSEKSELEKTVKILERSISEHKDTVSNLENSLRTSAAVPPPNEMKALRATVQELRQEVGAKDEQIERLKSENATLRERIRKLAVN